MFISWRLPITRIPNIRLYTTNTIPSINATKVALKNKTHNLKANSVYCCGTGCVDCAWILYLDGLEEHLKSVGSPEEVLAKKLEGAESWIQCFVRRDMEYRRIVAKVE